jgi:hypothetical protein
VIFWQVPFADYAYLDEAHQLWHNKDGTNFVMFANQGRFITGWIIHDFFDRAGTIVALKYLRIFSLIGWGLAIFFWHYLMHRWNRILLLPLWVLNFSSIFLACSLPVAISIGWASCLEMFIGFAAAILSGNFLFMQFTDPVKHRGLSFSKTFAAVLLGVVSLFIYQNCFACCLVPFGYYFFFVSRKIDKTLVGGIAGYFFILAIYFVLFKFSLDYFELPASDRTGLYFNPLKKLSFFVSHPLALAFSFNFLYNYHGIASQAFYPVCVLFLILSTYFLNNRIVTTAKIIGVILGVALLMYIPGLIVNESFASYRTMLALSLFIPVIVFGNFYLLIQKTSYQKIVLPGFIVTIVLVAYYNFNVQFVNPLQYEYVKLRDRLDQQNWQMKDTVFFTRPDEKAFWKSHQVRVYKDEFGLPSTFKDWTPDPLVRQVCLENTASREKAQSLVILQRVAGDPSWEDTGDNLVIDADSILKRN